jgi:hypothetical protein
MNNKWMPATAGILNIIVGSLSLIAGVLGALLVGVFFSDSYDGYSGQEFSALAVWLVLFIPLFIVSLLSIIGGIFALKKKNWGLALAGSIGSLLTLWAWPLGITSIIFVSLSRSEFDRKGSMFPDSVIPPSSPPEQPPL